MNIVFLPLARLTFSIPDADDNFNKSCRMLEGLTDNLQRPQEMLTSPEMLADYLATVPTPDLVIYQCTTFVGGDFVTEITRRFDCPIIIWSLCEPTIDGGRLKLNSLTGAFSAGNNLYMQGRSYRFVFGSPDVSEVMQAFRQTLKAIDVVCQLHSLVIGVVGAPPAGFGFGDMDEAMLADKLGVRIVRTEASSLMKTALAYPPDACTAAVEELIERTKGWETLPAENVDKHARLRTAYKEFTDTNGIKALASRCWPDFFTEYGVPVCSVLSFLNDCGVATSCETDMGGAISMFIGAALTGSATFFGDPVAIDDSCGGIVFWHCGAGAPSLARHSEGARVGVHPNRKIGPTMEFGLKKGVVTMLRLGQCREGLRVMAMRGEALDVPQRFWGTSLTFKPISGTALEKVKTLVVDGWEPHFVVAYGDVVEELRHVCAFLDIPFTKF